MTLSLPPAATAATASQLQKEKREQLFFHIEELKGQHADLAGSIGRINSRIHNLTEDLAASGQPLHLLRSISTKH